jgi:uncharacterized protein YcnI
MQTSLARLTTAAGLGTAALVLAAAPAFAHVGTSIKEVPAGSRTPLGLTIGHGCEDSPTTAVAVQVPEGINDATAFAKPGWTIVSEKETLTTPITSAHGDPVTERVSTITFTAVAGNALPTELRDVFTINFTAPDAPGETLFFKTVQSCEVGENAWIQEYDGTGDEPDSPAPTVLVTEPVDDEHAEATDDDNDGDEVAAEPASSTDSEGDGDGTAVGIAALVVGGLGLVTGGLALAKARKTS